MLFCPVLGCAAFRACREYFESYSGEYGPFVVLIGQDSIGQADDGVAAGEDASVIVSQGAKPQQRMTNGCSSSTTGGHGPDVHQAPYCLAEGAASRPSGQRPPEP
jgi:hypothetical protein